MIMINYWSQKSINRYRRKYPKVDASIFESVLSHTRSLGRDGKKEKKIACPLLKVFACGQVSSPRLYRLNLKNYIPFWKLKWRWSAQSSKFLRLTNFDQLLISKPIVGFQTGGRVVSDLTGGSVVWHLARFDSWRVFGPIWVSTLGGIFHLARCLRYAVFCHSIGSAVGETFGHLAKSPSDKIRQPVRIANYDDPGNYDEKNLTYFMS